MNGWLICAIVAGGAATLFLLVVAFAIVIIAAGLAAVRDGVFEPTEPTTTKQENRRTP